MIKNISLFLVLFCLGSLSAQNFKGKINPFPSDNRKAYTAQDSLKILAVMVNFQTDRDDATFGDGKFGSIYTGDYGTSIIDPLPHDKAYFEAHLEFVKNYFSKVSNGHQNIQYFVLPDTLTVSQTMRNYSPSVNSDDFTNLAKFSEEVWILASQQYPQFDFSDYDVFTIFHAGVGRDVTLPGSLGNERDLPSVYLSLNAFREIYNDQNFNGFPVGNGFNITNTMIIPETESREVSSASETFLFELTINGLLAASVASHLGLPDLFDTETGISAIGKFGLMDGQSIFAFNGVFPPEPSAWEKIFLGWAEPETVPLSNNIFNASVSGADILKVPINSSEYYLVENRLRDADANGSILTYVINGVPNTKTFTKDTTGYNTISVDSLSGVITNVDDFDWALPGSGVLIWHIDEKIINEKIADNKINADKNNRGVDLEEADGVQDIGEKFFTVFGDEVIGEGTKEDLWYAENEAYLYENRFSSETRPNTNSNAGANSLIKFSNFSAINPVATFNIAFGDSIVKPISAFALNKQGNVQALTSISGLDSTFDLLLDSSLYRVTGQTVQLLQPNFSAYKTASFEFNGQRYTAGGIGRSFNIFSHSNNTLISNLLPEGEVITTSPVVRMIQDKAQIAVGTSTSKLFVYTFNSPNDIQVSSPGMLTGTIIKKIALTNDGFMAISDVEKSLFSESGFIAVVNMPKTSMNQYSAAKLNKDLVVSGADNIVLSTDGIEVNYLYNLDYLTKVLKPQGYESLSEVTVADLKNNGSNYILYVNGNNIEAVNSQGASAEHFPFTDPLGLGFTGIPLSADFEGDGKAEVIAYTIDGRIFAIDGGTGEVIKGFPLSAGAELAVPPVLYLNNQKTSIAAVDKQNNFHSWTIGADAGNLIWAEKNGNAQNTSSVEQAQNTNAVNEFFPESKIYNYPNPVYESATAIRYYVSEDSKINIKIFDLAGDFVAEMNDNARGGFDGETMWNVSNIQSGVYLARVEATSANGKSESKIIKIAIVK